MKKEPDVSLPFSVEPRGGRPLPTSRNGRGPRSTGLEPRRMGREPVSPPETGGDPRLPFLFPSQFERSGHRSRNPQLAASWSGRIEITRAKKDRLPSPFLCFHVSRFFSTRQWREPNDSGRAGREAARGRGVLKCSSVTLCSEINSPTF